MITSQVRSMVNPHRTKKRRKNPAARRRKLSPKQIKIFGTKAQKAALKRRRTKKRAVANPAPKHRRRVATKRRAKAKVRTVTKVVYKTRRAKRRKNPGIVTLGLINPTGGKVAKRRKKARRVTASHSRRRRVAANPARRVRRRRRANPTRVVVRYRGKRRSNPGRHRRRSNPSMGGVGDLAINTLAGILSNSASKFVATQVSGMLGQSSPFITAGIQIATGFGLHKISPAKYKNAVLLGSLIGAGTTILAQIAPGLGLGDWVSAPLLLPYNGIRTGMTQAKAMQQAALAASTGGKSARMGVSGIGRSFGRSF